MLKAGVALTDITPKEPLRLAGYPIPADRAGLTVHDPLYCSAFYFRNEETEVLMITLDLVFVTKKQTRQIREAIHQRTGIKPGNISVSCTHTHSGPMTTGAIFGVYNEEILLYPEYIATLVESIVQTAVDAWQNTFDATVGYNSTRCGKEKNIGGNRHDKNGPSDDEIYAIGIKDQEGKVRGVLTSYSLHPTLLHADSYAYSADYPGYMRAYFESVYPGSVFGFQMGTSGNQSPRHFRTGQTFKEAKRYGDTLGAAAHEALEKASFTDQITLKVDSIWVNPILKNLPSAEQAALEAEEAQRRYDEAEAAGIDYGSLRTLEVTLIGANLMATLTRQLLEPGAREGMMAAYPFEIQVIRIGDLAIVLSAGELFVEIGLAIKEKSPFKHTYIASTSNGSTGGYIVTPEAFEKRGYEALGTVLSPEMAAKTVSEALRAIEKIR